MPGQQHGQPSLDFIGSRVYACLGITLHPHFWQNDQGLLHANAVTRGGTDTEKSQHTKLTLEKKHSHTTSARI